MLQDSLGLDPQQILDPVTNHVRVVLEPSFTVWASYCVLTKRKI